MRSACRGWKPCIHARRLPPCRCRMHRCAGSCACRSAGSRRIPAQCPANGALSGCGACACRPLQGQSTRRPAPRGRRSAQNRKAPAQEPHGPQHGLSVQSLSSQVFLFFGQGCNAPHNKKMRGSVKANDSVAETVPGAFTLGAHFFVCTVTRARRERGGQLCPSRQQ